MPSDISAEKKLKQSRLPFSPVDPKTQKKRKLSAESETRSPKLLCSESPSTSKRTNDGKSALKDSLDDINVNDPVPVEEKENIKDQLSEPKLNDEEKSDDDLEIVAVKKKDGKKSPIKEQKSGSSVKNESPIQQQKKNAEPTNKSKRKRTSSAKGTSSSNTIKKMFKDVNVKSDVLPKVLTAIKSDNEKKNVSACNNLKETICLTSDDEETPDPEAEVSSSTKSKNQSVSAKSTTAIKSDNEKKNVSACNNLKETICLTSDAEETPDPEAEVSSSTKSKNQSVSAKSKDNSIGQEHKNKGKKNKTNRNRTSTGKSEASPNAIAKMFQNVEEKNETSLKDSSTLKSESEKKENFDDNVKETMNISDNGETTERDSEKSNSSGSNSSLSQSEVDIEVEKNKPLIVKTPLPHKSVTHIRKLTPKQKQIKEKSMQKQEEKIKLKQEKEAERLKQMEEKQKKKQEELEAKEKEKEEKKLKKEEERLKREEKKEEERLKKEEEKQKKEEEKQKKEEEKQKKEEEKLLAEEEEREKKKKLQAKFAKFFVPKKVETPTKQIETILAADNFVHFRIKENMKIAPIVRRSLSDEQRNGLEKILNLEGKEISMTYLKAIKKKNYKAGKAFKTFPPIDKNDDAVDECEIISDEEIDGTDVLDEIPSQCKNVRVKFLQFCENSRPAYYGTWSKKPARLSGRKPFAKEEVFDYDYDSDEDWEDIENGESLSDSDGEGDEGSKEEVNQYEVDNDFFVPHGYLSDGEGEDEEENEATAEEKKEEKDENFQKEKLKQKQEEFELEMKQKTKQLKPKVFGCVWLGDKSSHQAYDQLLKLLLPHRSVVMFGSCPIDVNSKDLSNQEMKDDDDDHDDVATQKFVKSFPDAAVPDLIRLIHGNRHSKLFLIREFSAYWKKKQEEEIVDSSNCGFIAMRKIEPKIQEIGQYGKFSENDVSLKFRTWYVSKDIREKFGLEDLSVNNTWNYTLPVKDRKKDDSKEEKQEESEEQITKNSSKAPFTGTNLITKFTKVLNAEEEKKKFSISSPSRSTSDMASLDVNKTPQSKAGKGPMNTPTSSVKKNKSKINVSASKSNVPGSASKEKPEISKPKNSIIAMFKNIEKGKKEERTNSSMELDEDLECITLE